MDRFVQFAYNDKSLPPMNDNESYELLSLDQTLEPVLSQFGQLHIFIKKAKQFRHHPSEHNLTEDESAAIYLYTDNCDTESLHRALNQVLQSEDRTVIEPWFGFLKLFNSALNKLPTAKDTIWRRLPTDSAGRLDENQELVCWGITSCSTAANIVSSNSDQSSVLCSIESLNGKDIHHYSAFPNDCEVLLLPGTRLLVKSKGANNTIGEPVICFEEISDVYEEYISLADVAMTSPYKSDNEEDVSDNNYPNENATTSPNVINKEPVLGMHNLANRNLEKNQNKAVVTFVNGDRYEVTYEHGKKQDDGKYYTVDRKEFEDQAAHDQANGEGICAFQNGDRFLGTFKRGLRHGHGILYKTDESIRIGNWDNDEPTDQGLKTISSSDKYEWVDEANSKRLYGAYSDNNGDRYIGNVNEDQAHGLGVRFWNDGSRYEGHFENDKKHGYGIYYYTDQDIYAGQWNNDEIDGNGELFWNSGSNYRGHFTNGKRHGHGKLAFANGKEQEGWWENDKYVD